MSYLLAFCGYVLILLIEKIIFSNVSIAGNEKMKEENLLMTELQDFKGGGDGTSLKEESKIENYQNSNQRSKPPSSNLHKVRFHTFKSEKEIIKISNIKQESLASHSKKNSLRINMNLNLDDIQSSKIRGLDRKEKEFKKIVSNLGQISTFAKEKCNISLRLVGHSDNNSPKKLSDKSFQKEPALQEPLINLNKSNNNIISYLIVVALSIHALFEGLALGLQDQSREIFYMLIAISFHKWVEALSIVKSF